MVTQKGCLFGLQHPLSLFQAAFPPLLSAMLPSAATTSPTSPSAGGDPASEQPAGADPPLENKRNKQSTRSVSDILQWCIGENCGDHLSLVDRDGEGQAGKLYCTLCGVWLSAKGAIIKDHCFGKNKKGEDGTFRRHPGFHATKAAAALAKPPPAPPAQPETQAQPTIIVNVTTPTKHGETLSPPAKKMKVDQSGSVVSMLNRGTAEQQFHKDITTAFTSVNIPLEKIGKPPLKNFLNKYIPDFKTVDPINYRGTSLPKVADEKRGKIEAIIRKREHYVVVFADETPEPRACPT